MTTVSEVVTTEIDIKDAAVSQEGFGTPMIIGYHTFWAERSRTFSDPDEMTVAPFNMPTTHPIYLAAQKVKSQKPSPPQFKVGKRLGAPTHTVKITPSAPGVAEVFSLYVDGTLVTYTADGTPTLAEVTAALTTAITALAGVTATDGSTFVTSAADVAGVLHRYENLSSNLKIQDVTTDPTPSIATDLAAIRAADSDWYWGLLDSNSEAEIEAAAVWAETQKLILMVTTMDSGAYDGAVTIDVASDLKTASYHRTALLFHEKPALQFAAAAWTGRIAPKTPGSYTAANKTLSGVDKSALGDTARGVLKGKNCNYYVDIKGVGFTLDGRAASGRYIDITHGMDWFEARVQERVVAVLANNDKIPYTDKGAELFRAQVEAQILEGIAAQLIDEASGYSVTVPRVKDVDSNTRTLRKLPDVSFDFVLAGAVHFVQIKGTVRTSAVSA